MSEACKDCKHYDGKYCDEDGKIHDRYDSCKDYAEQRMTKNNKTLDFSEVGLFHLDKMLTDNTISSISSFITLLNRLLKNNRSTLLVSLQEGTKCLVETFIKEIINQLPTYISKPLKSGRHYLCKDFSKYI